MNPLVDLCSVVIPIYNASRFIRETLASVFAQTRLPDEIVVVDDCSPDDTVAGLEAIARVGPVPVMVVRRPYYTVGRSIVCFADAGGTPEFVENDCGFIVPYLDIDPMCDRLVALAADSNMRYYFGKQAAAKVRLRHDLSVAGPKLLKEIMNMLGAV